VLDSGAPIAAAQRALKKRFSLCDLAHGPTREWGEIASSRRADQLKVAPCAQHPRPKTKKGFPQTAGNKKTRKRFLLTADNK